METTKNITFNTSIITNKYYFYPTNKPSRALCRLIKQKTFTAKDIINLKLFLDAMEIDRETIIIKPVPEPDITPVLSTTM